MAGHSKWANIKRRKGAQDAQRGKIFTKINREIMVAARIGGGDADANPRLRQAIVKARAANMPVDTIDRAIKKGTGDLEGVSYENVLYEGYGPAGVAVMVEVLTDNRNRTVAEVRHIFTKHNGNLGENGCVSWMFEMKGVITFSADKVEEDALVEAALEAGVEDIREEDGYFEITTAPEDFNQVREAFEAAGMEFEEAEVTMLAQNTISLDGKDAVQALRLIEALEDSDDVQKVHSNFDIPDDVMENL